MQNMNKIKEYLTQNNVKPSYPRLRIMEYLTERRNHPTADMIFHALVEEMPTLSKATVYNTLNLFAEKKVVMPINIENNEIRYDATVSLHGHFKCLECGAVYDFTVHHIEHELEELKGFQIDNKNVYYKGICPECLNNKIK